MAQDIDGGGYGLVHVQAGGEIIHGWRKSAPMTEQRLEPV